MIFGLWYWRAMKSHNKRGCRRGENVCVCGWKKINKGVVDVKSRHFAYKCKYFQVSSISISRAEGESAKNKQCDRLNSFPIDFLFLCIINCQFRCCFSFAVLLWRFLSCERSAFNWNEIFTKTVNLVSGYLVESIFVCILLRVL